jgi:hypothetical protein
MLRKARPSLTTLAVEGQLERRVRRHFGCGGILMVPRMAGAGNHRLRQAATALELTRLRLGFWGS